MLTEAWQLAHALFIFDFWFSKLNGLFLNQRLSAGENTLTDITVGARHVILIGFMH